jgi:hypothetical protein
MNRAFSDFEKTIITQDLWADPSERKLESGGLLGMTKAQFLYMQSGLLYGAKLLV